MPANFFVLCAGLSINHLKQNEALSALFFLCLFTVYKRAASPKSPAPITPGAAVMSGAMPEAVLLALAVVAATTVLDALLTTELASLDALLTTELAELLKLAMAEVSLPAEAVADESAELTEEDTDAREEVAAAASEEAEDMIVAALPAELTPELLPVPDG